MGRFFLDAKSHADKIDHYYKTAGAAGFAKAKFHGAKLADIAHRASRTDKGRGDAFSISVLSKKANAQLDEMREREMAAVKAKVDGDKPS